MLYQAYQAHTDLMTPVRAVAELTRHGFTHLPAPFRDTLTARSLAAGCELMERAHLTHERPPFGIDSVKGRRRTMQVREVAADVRPFGTLLHFQKDNRLPQPKVLLVAPLSGHFATLLRGTALTLLAEHDVYITDWHNARNVGLEQGRFGFDDYVEHLIDWLALLGPGTHLMAVCQPCVPALVAASVMAQGRHPAQPASLTLMAGPIDTRVRPTTVNELAAAHPLEWFDRNLITTVPWRYPGRLRRVFPGFLQVASFMAMNPERHMSAHRELYQQLVDGDEERAAVTKDFYAEYFAVLDMTAEFYLETVDFVFQRQLLAKGALEYHGRKVEPKAIRRTSLFTIEGERDDICSPGQTYPAHDLCSSVKPMHRRHHLQPGVGHYGVFGGRRWETQIYPLVRNHILASAERTAA
jgi:polyhydroxyalkanoate depolymerase